MDVLRQKEDFKTNNWSGGTTTELYIHPAQSVFKNLDFDFRLSIATVETATSTFTSLPGVSRKLLLLEGSLHLNHLGHHETDLKPLEWDTFSGDWQTLSKGKVTDFNLMLTGKNTGDFEIIKTVEKKEISIALKADIICFYVKEGGLKVKNQVLNKDTLLVHHVDTENTVLSINPNTTLIIVRIHLQPKA
ncbi:hypothetical protein DNU06_09755 [Putridiphycobacter roseus]|uniref:HutD-family protein n=1 Tax=Putridiphycobacter roseus TaxID=2219161 RepID=A0A2W1N011_9FLAO|nr:HutD family protein [Putridiphycobacter roseus]PZE17024.1 hypothetical protein DNU06_09755 [Putridiphycobacter roseus]